MYFYMTVIAKKQDTNLYLELQQHMYDVYMYHWTIIEMLTKIIYLLYFTRVYWPLLHIYELCSLCHLPVAQCESIKAYQGLPAIETWINTLTLATTHGNEQHCTGIIL